MRVFAVHLLNDFSGSPKVLKQLVQGWIAEQIPVTVVTTGNRDGFLSRIKGTHYLTYWYRWNANRWLRLINLVTSQLILFSILLVRLQRDDIVYVNTVLPFGAAIAGKLRGCRVLYHVHETSMSPPILKSLLFFILRLTSSDVIYVSKYLMKNEPAPGKKVHLLQNALENSFVERATRNKKSYRTAQKVLMICSLKAYKGIYEFVALAKRCQELSFRLVVNASQNEVDLFIQDTNPTANLEVFPVQSDVHPFYSWADVVVNLSRPKEWIETFGLTVIESYAYGIPVIVPPVGGIADIVDEGSTGFHVDSSEQNHLVGALNAIVDPGVYSRFSHNSAQKALDFGETTLIRRSLQIILSRSIGN